MTDDLAFQVLGGLRAQRDGRELDLGGPRQRRVLAGLLLSIGRPVAPDRLVELVWGEDAPPSARGSLQAYVSKLRAVLEPGHRAGTPFGVLATRSGGYVLDVCPSTVDLVGFERAVGAGQGALDDARPGAAIAVLTPALDRWAPVLPELADVPVVVAAARRAASVHAAGVEALQRARLAIGDHHAAIADLQTAVAEEPRAEGLWALLALALHRSGRPAEALETIARARTVLRDATGLELGAELRRLEADLLAGSPAVAGPDVAPARRSRRPARCPATRRVRSVPARPCAALARPR